MEVLHQPLFWNSKMRLSFLRDASDWVELKARGTNPDLMEKLESIAWRIFDEEWNGKIDRKVIRHMRGIRAYKFKRVRDLLRIVRNTFCHAIGLPRNIQVCFYFPVQLLQGNFASMMTWTLPITSLLPIRKSLVYVRCLSIYSTIIKPVRQ